MRLSDLEAYGPITIQCHDNPDADTLGSAYGLYCYFRRRGIPVRMVYSGSDRIQKANLRLLVSRLALPIEYVSPGESAEGLLVTVDCQYGAGNVTGLQARRVAVLDHHQPEERQGYLFCRIDPELGSCCTLVWELLRREKYPFEEDTALSTALYYGLFMDTNQLAEAYHPLDLEMRDALRYDKLLLTRLRCSNLSLEELNVAGDALNHYIYDEKDRFAVIPTRACDPNILGLISDFLLQVDEIDSCVVYNLLNDRYRLSVRSCVRGIKASELAAFLTEGIGSGGGHLEKAGGSISAKLYEERYGGLPSETYFVERMREFCGRTSHGD